jgi:hypothetical protein
LQTIFSPEAAIFGVYIAESSFFGSIAMLNSARVKTTAAAIALSALVATPQAEAGNGGAIAAGAVIGLATGAIIGSAIASHPPRAYYYGGPTYYAPPPRVVYRPAPVYVAPRPVYVAPRCWLETRRVWDGYGWYRQKVEVCR